MGLGTGGWGYPVLEPVKSLYACENLHLMTLPMRQNLGPAAAFRAPGVMEGTFAFENLVFPEPGEYRLKLFVSGEFLTERGLHISTPP